VGERREGVDHCTRRDVDAATTQLIDEDLDAADARRWPLRPMRRK
jgi:hypothetical protein